MAARLALLAWLCVFCATTLRAEELTFLCDAVEGAGGLMPVEDATGKPVGQRRVVIDTTNLKARVAGPDMGEDEWRTITINGTLVQQDIDAEESCGGLCGDFQFDLAALKGQDEGGSGWATYSNCQPQ